MTNPSDARRVMTLPKVLTGDCREMMKELDSDSIDAIVTDPPYELNLMGKSWDRSGIAYDPAVWSEAFRILKPGGHILVFGGTRTHHRVWCAIEDAGFQIRDTLAWVYGSGFPKSLDVSKAIDRMAGAEREVVSSYERKGRQSGIMGKEVDIIHNLTSPATPAAIQWQGWGTGLKPSLEPVCLARKPLSERNVALNVLKWGTGAINIDGCRVGTEQKLVIPPIQRTKGEAMFPLGKGSQVEPSGRFPANLIHDGSDEVMKEFPNTGVSSGGKGEKSQNPNYSGDTVGSFLTGIRANMGGIGDSGSAARFFYCAKSSRSERDAGLDGDNVACGGMQARHDGTLDGHITMGKNDHATVKPLKLMRYLITLITPPGGIVCDPFAGSGSTLIAAKELGFNYVGIELDPHNVEIIQKRLEAVKVERQEVLL